MNEGFGFFGGHRKPVTLKPVSRIFCVSTFAAFCSVESLQTLIFSWVRGTEKTMTATDVTGFDAISPLDFSLLSPGFVGLVLLNCT